MSDKLNRTLLLISRGWMSVTALAVMSVIVGCSCLWLIPCHSLSAQPEGAPADQPYYAGYLQAQLLIKSGEMDPARKLLEGMARHSDCPPAVLETLAELYTLDGKSDKAMELASKAIADDPSQVRFYVLRARQYETNKELDKALADLETASKLEPRNQSVLEALSDLYMERIKQVTTEADLIREVQGLTDLFEKMSQSREGVERLPSLMILSSLYMRQQDYEKAAQRARDAIAIKQDDPRPYQLLAEALDGQGDHAQALDTLGQALLLDPHNEKTLDRLDKMLAESDGKPSPLEFYTGLVDKHPDNQDLQKILIGMLVDERQWSQAETALTTYLNKWPDDLEGRVWLMRVWLSTAREQKAIDEVRRLDSEHNELAPKVAVAVASSLFHGGQQETAIKLLADLAQSNPDNEDIAETLTQFYLDADQPERAADVIKPMAERDPSNLTATVLLAQAYADQGKFDDINSMLDKLPEDVQRRYASELTILRSNICLSQGLHFQEQGDNAQAEKLYREAIKLNPDDPETYNSLGYFLAESGGDLNEAQQLIQKALELSPDTGHIIDSMGWVLFRKGEYAKAIAQLEKAVDLLKASPDAVIFDHLGDAYEQIGQIEQARTAWQKAYELNPEATSVSKKLERTAQ